MRREAACLSKERLLKFLPVDSIGGYAVENGSLGIKNSEVRKMTICIAALCDGGKSVVFASDHMLTSSRPLNVEFEH